MNGSVSIVSFSVCLWLVYRKAIKDEFSVNEENSKLVKDPSD